MTEGTHHQHETDSWTTNVGDHPGRTDSPTYTRHRRFMIEIAKTLPELPYGGPPWQDHHGGGVWVFDGTWRLYLLPWGIEWSAQFCADPEKVDWLRQQALALVLAFTGTEDAYRQLGMTEDDLGILVNPVRDAAGVAKYVDSIWNASVPMGQADHVAVAGKDSHVVGIHHAPKPIVDIGHFCRADFIPYVTTADGVVAVAPMAPRGSGDGRVAVLWHSTRPELEHQVLNEEHSLAKAAFALQEESAR